MLDEVVHHDQVQTQVGHHHHQDWDVEVDHSPDASFLDNLIDKPEAKPEPKVQICIKSKKGKMEFGL